MDRMLPVQSKVTNEVRFKFVTQSPSSQDNQHSEVRLALLGEASLTPYDNWDLCGSSLRRCGDLKSNLGLFWDSIKSGIQIMKTPEQPLRAIRVESLICLARDRVTCDP
jgi:hypothetical protein